MGLIQFWAKDAKIGYRMISARAETVASKSSFRSAFRSRRCLVVADGFYEWQKQDKKAKQPYHITLAAGGPFGFAGLWETWKDPEGEIVESCAIITTLANELCAQIHDRMPVILAANDHDAWLAPDIPANELQDLLKSYLANAMVAHPISKAVGNIRDDEPGVLEPVGAPL